MRTSPTHRIFSSKTSFSFGPELPIIEGMKRIAILLSLLVACAHQGPENQLDPRIAENALNEWTDTGMPAGECSEQVDQITVRFLGQLAAQRACHVVDEICGCINSKLEIVLVEEPGCSVEVSLQHELRHWLAQCSLGHSDFYHSTDEVWYPMADGRQVRSDADFRN